MRILSTVFVLIISTSLLGCSSGGEINGRSLKTANRSAAMIKDRLPTEKRIEFEVSYWTLRASMRKRDDFLDAVGGKTVDEVIVLGKEVFQSRKSSGFKKYDQYSNWDQMIAKFTQERIDQNRHKKAPDTRDKENSVIYKL